MQGISDLITLAGDINIDFADVRTVMEGQGDAIMGIGVGSGENRAQDAAEKAVNNPLLDDARIEGARNILVNVTCGEDFSLTEYQDVIDLITSKAAEDAHIIAGVVSDGSLKDEVRVTVIATGFGSAHQKFSDKGAFEKWLSMPLGSALKRIPGPTSGLSAKRNRRRTVTDLPTTETGHPQRKFWQSQLRS